MVWFHGGGYTGGGNIQYPGHFLASHDVVVVVPNYRLNVFGMEINSLSTNQLNCNAQDSCRLLMAIFRATLE
jgi:carboxylesterase type B